MARQTRSAVQGMSMWRTPRWLTASITAFCTAGVEPMRARLADALGPERVERGRGLHRGRRSKLGSSAGRDDGVVGEVGVSGLPSSSYAHLLEQGLGRALGDAAVDLTVDQHRVDDACRRRRRRRGAGEPHLAGLGVDLDHGDVGAEREGRALGGEVGRPMSASLGPGGGDLGPGRRRRRACRRRGTAGVGVEHDVVDVGLEQLGGQLPGLVDELAEAVGSTEPAICTEREPPVTLPLGTRSVSPWMTSIRSMGMPRRSRRQHRPGVSWPWPYGRGPVRTSTVPSAQDGRPCRTRRRRRGR